MGGEVRRIGRQEQQRAAPPFDQLAHPLPLMRAEVVQDHHLPRPQRRRQNLLHIGLEDCAFVVGPSTARHGPMPLRVMLAKSVVFGPRGFWVPCRKPARLLEPSHRDASWRCEHRTRPRRRDPRGLSPALLFASELSLPRLARKPGATFFERKPQPLERAAHGGGGDLYAAFLLKELAVLGQV